MKVRILGNVKHNGQILNEYEVYDLDTKSAKALLKTKNATVKNVESANVSPLTPTKVKIGADGRRVPGEVVADTQAAKTAKEQVNKKAVKAVEPKTNTGVQGDDEDASDETDETEGDENGKQGQENEGKEEAKEDSKETK